MPSFSLSSPEWRVLGQNPHCPGPELGPGPPPCSIHWVCQVCVLFCAAELLPPNSKAWEQQCNRAGEHPFLFELRRGGFLSPLRALPLGRHSSLPRPDPTVAAFSPAMGCLFLPRFPLKDTGGLNLSSLERGESRDRRGRRGRRRRRSRPRPACANAN